MKLFALNQTGSVALSYLHALLYGKLGFILRGWPGTSPLWDNPVVCTSLKVRMVETANGFAHVTYTFRKGNRVMARFVFNGRKLPWYHLRRFVAFFHPSLDLLADPQIFKIDFRASDRDSFGELVRFAHSTAGWSKERNEEVV